MLLLYFIKINSQIMCAILTKDATRTCSGKCSQLCKRGKHIEQLQVNLKELFNKAAAINNSMLPVVANYGLANISFHAKEGNHI